VARHGLVSSIVSNTSKSYNKSQVDIESSESGNVDVRV
jgi:hypothetical protein